MIEMVDGFRSLRSGDLADLDLGEQLAMAHFLAEAFAAFHLERRDLFSLDLTHDLRIDLHVDVGTNAELSIGVHQEHFGELDLVAVLAFDVGNVEFLTFMDLELLAGDLDYCKHHHEI